ncbi:hypothetical protein D3C72_2093430 [compost metagenome]
MQVDAVGIEQVARAVYAARYLVVDLHGRTILGDLAQFLGQRRFHAARAWAKI